jgi:Spy/CpxP family protein refolding chaperone
MKKIVMLLVLLAIAGAISFAAARWAVSRKAGFDEMRWMQRELKLSDAQGAQLSRISAEFRRELERFCAEHCAARFELGEELVKGEPDRAKIESLTARMANAQTACERATVHHILAVREFLTPAQQKRYGELVQTRVCSVCPLGLHHP